MNIKQPIVILSAYSSNLSLKENFNRDFRLQLQLKQLNLNYKPVAGVYMGNKEPSFVVAVNSQSDIEQLKLLAERYQQECYLYSDANRLTSLHYEDGRVEVLGTLKAIPEAVALTLSNYTADYENNVFYTTVK